MGGRQQRPACWYTCPTSESAHRTWLQNCGGTPASTSARMPAASLFLAQVRMDSGEKRRGGGCAMAAGGEEWAAAAAGTIVNAAARSALSTAQTLQLTQVGSPQRGRAGVTGRRVRAAGASTSPELLKRCQMASTSPELLRISHRTGRCGVPLASLLWPWSQCAAESCGSIEMRAWQAEIVRDGTWEWRVFDAGACCRRWPPHCRRKPRPLAWHEPCSTPCFPLGLAQVHAA